MTEPVYTRERTRVLSSSSIASVWTKRYYNGVEFGTGLGTCNSSVTETMKDVQVPNFYRRRARGEIINNPMEKTVTTIVESPFNYDFIIGENYVNDDETQATRSNTGQSSTGKHSQAWLRGVAKPTFTAPSPTWGDAETEAAISAAWAGIDSTEVQSLVIIAEARKTVTSLTAIFQRLLKVFKALKKLQLKEAAGIISGKDAADRYLEIRFAIRPLLYDVREIVAFWDNPAKLPRFTSRATRSTEWSDIFFKDQLYALYGEASTVTTCNASFEARAGVLFDFNLSGFSHTLQRLGFGQIAETVWETLPFSFLIDYFFNVGSVVASWTPQAGTNVLTSWVTTEKSVLQQLTYHDFHVKSGYTHSVPVTVDPYISSDGGSYSKLVVETKRIVEPDRPILPTFIPDIGVAKLADIILIARKVLWKD